MRPLNVRTSLCEIYGLCEPRPCEPWESKEVWTRSGSSEWLRWLTTAALTWWRFLPMAFLKDTPWPAQHPPVNFPKTQELVVEKIVQMLLWSTEAAPHNISGTSWNHPLCDATLSARYAYCYTRLSSIIHNLLCQNMMSSQCSQHLPKRIRS